MPYDDKTRKPGSGGGTTDILNIIMSLFGNALTMSLAGKSAGVGGSTGALLGLGMGVKSILGQHAANEKERQKAEYKKFLNQREIDLLVEQGYDEADAELHVMTGGKYDLPDLPETLTPFEEAEQQNKMNKWAREDIDFKDKAGEAARKATADEMELEEKRLADAAVDRFLADPPNIDPQDYKRIINSDDVDNKMKDTAHEFYMARFEEEDEMTGGDVSKRAGAMSRRPTINTELYGPTREGGAQSFLDQISPEMRMNMSEEEFEAASAEYDVMMQQLGFKVPLDKAEREGIRAAQGVARQRRTVKVLSAAEKAEKLTSFLLGEGEGGVIPGAEATVVSREGSEDDWKIIQYLNGRKEYAVTRGKELKDVVDFKGLRTKYPSVNWQLILSEVFSEEEMRSLEPYGTAP